MLYPKLNNSRALIDLSGVWDFQLANGEEGFDQQWYRAPLKAAEAMAVPGAYNDQKSDAAHRTHYGWAFYQRTIRIPKFFEGERVVLRFGSVTQSAKVYLDGELLCAHKGGFLPFEAELTDRLPAGKEALLTVAVDNRVDYSTLPVGNEGTIAFFGSDNAGIPSVELAKSRQKPFNRPNFDFFNYAGIQRPVKIYTTPKDYIADITLVPSVQGSDGVVDYDVAVVGEGSVSLEIVDEAGKTVASAQGAKGSVTIPNAKLWEPGSAYLYTAKVTFGADEYEQAFGVRTVEVKGTQFLINGKPFYFKGFGKHEDSAIHGRGLDECFNVKDLSLIHWLGANSFRTSHYPYAEEMYDLCDREGIVIIDEVPAVGIGMGPSKDPYKNMRIHEHHRDVIRDLIDRDKNHPSVVMWSIANEPDTEHFPQSAYDYFRPLYELAHSCDPQDRPVTLVCCQNDYEKDIVTRTMDVVCLNRYYGWYNLSGDLDAACDALNIEFDFWQDKGKPVMFTEYGADTVAGIHGTVPEMFNEEFQVAYYSRINAQFDKRDFFIGEQMWNFADFATIQGPMRVDGNKKGLFTRDRRPKMAAHYFRQRWQEVPDFGYKAQK